LGRDFTRPSTLTDTRPPYFEVEKHALRLGASAPEGSARCTPLEGDEGCGQLGHSGPSGSGGQARAEITANTVVSIDREEASRTYVRWITGSSQATPPKGPLGEGGALCNCRSMAVPSGPHRHSSIFIRRCSGDCDLQLQAGRWILGWGNLVHDTMTMPGSCSERARHPERGGGH